MAQPRNIWMPSDQDVGPTYTLRVTAINPTTGAVTPNVNVGEVVMDVTAIGQNIQDLAQGQWFLVPGPNA